MRALALIIGIAVVVITVSGCSSSKSSQSDGSTETTTPKANLLDGSWDVNYILPQAKSFSELFAEGKPSITFNSVDGRVGGSTGCNQFSGSFTTNEYSISIPAEMALTKKMCQNMAGEMAFLETLKKVNSYSVTEQGKVLNLMMGDIAIIRASRK